MIFLTRKWEKRGMIICKLIHRYLQAQVRLIESNSALAMPCNVLLVGMEMERRVFGTCAVYFTCHSTGVKNLQWMMWVLFFYESTQPTFLWSWRCWIRTYDDLRWPKVYTVWHLKRDVFEIMWVALFELRYLSWWSYTKQLGHNCFKYRFKFVPCWQWELLNWCLYVALTSFSAALYYSIVGNVYENANNVRKIALVDAQVSLSKRIWQGTRFILFISFFLFLSKCWYLF
jgi:hypothetical protein